MCSRLKQEPKSPPEARLPRDVTPETSAQFVDSLGWLPWHTTCTHLRHCLLEACSQPPRVRPDGGGPTQREMIGFVAAVQQRSAKASLNPTHNLPRACSASISSSTCSLMSARRRSLQVKVADGRKGLPEDLQNLTMEWVCSILPESGGDQCCHGSDNTAGN